MDRTIGIDASRSRSGGGKAHIKAILLGCCPLDYGFKRVHLWAFPELAATIPSFPWLEVHVPRETSGGVLQQLWWQYNRFPKEAARAGCDLVFNSDAGSVSPFQPSVTLSHDMLSFEPGEMQRYGWSKARLRLEVLRWVQARSLKNSDLAIFLTQHASTVIQREIGKTKEHVVVPHGIAEEFRMHPRERAWPRPGDAMTFLYVSNAAMYKHQWHVIRAFGELRKEGYTDVRLLLVGGGSGVAQRLLEEALKDVDPQGQFIKQREYIAHKELPQVFRDSHAFVFASSCENMPITLMEAMASGLPIACSNRGPMPEVLQSAGVYFDPENPETIRLAVKRIIEEEAVRQSIASKAHEIASQFTWERCAHETWTHLQNAGFSNKPKT